jgi:acetyltransferase-like isoleucine patch superfamily enzyme
VSDLAVGPNRPLDIDPEAVVDQSVRFYPSVRGSRIVVGQRTHIDAFAIIRCVGGMGDVVIDADSRIGPHCVLYSGNGITIGKFVLMAPHVSVVPANHAFHSRDVPMAHQRFLPSRGGVVIEDDVCIGAQAVLLDGTHIERGAIIAAGSVVRGHVPAYQIWGGVPAHFIKDRP